MADTMALETPQGVFQTNEATPDELLVGNNDVAMRDVDEKNSQSTSLVKSSNVDEYKKNITLIKNKLKNV